MRRAALLLFVVWCFGATPLASADMFTPSHSCSKPRKPYSFTSEWEVDAFERKVKAYRQCISAFVDEQGDAATNHNNAAQGAIDEWNHYIKYELK